MKTFKHLRQYTGKHPKHVSEELPVDIQLERMNLP